MLAARAAANFRATLAFITEATDVRALREGFKQASYATGERGMFEWRWTPAMEETLPVHPQWRIVDGFFLTPGPIGLILAIVLAVVLIAAWVILAASRFVQGGVVERPERVPQLYGYTACLIGLLMSVTSLLSLVEAGLSLANPVYQSPSEEWGGWAEPSVTSFEAFRATYDRARELRASPDAPPVEPLAEDELQRRYEALRADRIARVQASARRTLVTSGLSFLIGLGLLAFHWRWLRRRSYEPASSVAT